MRMINLTTHRESDKMTTLAKKYEYGFANGSIDIESIAVEKDQDFNNERTYWIFEDGSALGIDSNNIIYVRTKYGRNKDHEQLAERAIK